MHRIAVFAATVAGLLALASCSDWKPYSFADRLAWADNDSGVALRVATGEIRTPLFGFLRETRDEQYDVYLEKPDGTGQRLIVSEKPGRFFDSGTFYYMKSHGYIMLVDGDLVDGTRVRQLWLDGTFRDIPRDNPAGAPDCDKHLFRAVPSPAGDRVAAIEDVTCAPFAPGSQRIPTSVLVRLLDATTLAEVRRDTLRQTLPVPDNWWQVWRPAGDLIVAADSTGWSLTAASPATRVVLPTCREPATTSSVRSSTGVGIATDKLTVHQTNTVPSLAFGCP
ncbi:MAG TPA: hypothetical protein VF483_13070 [Gemmatimonadaceae bacterium]